RALASAAMSRRPGSSAIACSTVMNFANDAAPWTGAVSPAFPPWCAAIDDSPDDSSASHLTHQAAASDNVDILSTMWTFWSSGEQRDGGRQHAGERQVDTLSQGATGRIAARARRSERDSH